jgi:hypothetical protein
MCLAAAVLLSTPFEFPFATKASELIAALAEQGVSQERFFLTLQWVVVHNDENASLYLIIGAPMRGVLDGELCHHLASWHIAPCFTSALHKVLERHAEDERTSSEYGAKLEQAILNWAQEATVERCEVRRTGRQPGTSLAP